jgi:hypothetical protein
MTNFFINELLYFTILFVIGFSLKKVFKSNLQNAFIAQIAACIVVIHFLIGLSFSLSSTKRIWFPFLLDINEWSSRARHDYDVENLITSLTIVYFVNACFLIWGLYGLRKSIRRLGKETKDIGNKDIQ